MTSRVLHLCFRLELQYRRVQTASTDVWTLYLLLQEQPEQASTHHLLIVPLHKFLLQVFTLEAVALVTENVNEFEIRHNETSKIYYKHL